jgi:hypothetical protein
MLVVTATAVLYAGRELAGLPIPVPQLRRQVPDWWRTFFGWPLAAFLYGAGLGVGFLTFLGHGTLVVVAVGIAATGRPGIGALVMAPFGLARGLAPLVSARSREPEDGRRLVDRLSSTGGRARSLLNAAAALGVGAAAAAAARAAQGGWGRAAAAVLAVTFAWAALSKVVAMGRWRRTIGGHRLSPGLEAAAAWTVPLVESLVPVLTILGWERSAAGVALASLSVFSIALLRAALLGGVRVPCSCFGRAAVDVRAALARNAALAGTALVSWTTASADPGFALPSGADLVPAVLAAAAAAAAATTAWRASVWFSRGRG